jgi:Spy/CpxP family protein refolding chaperone
MSRTPGNVWAVALTAVALLTSVGFAQNKTAQATGVSSSADTGPSIACSNAQRAQVRADIAKLRADARAHIRALLTPDQQTKFDALPALQGPPGPHGAGRGLGCGAGGPRGMGKGLGPCAGGPRGIGKGFGPCAGGPRSAAAGAKAPHWFLDRLSEKLNLTDAQQASIAPILDQTRAARQVRREQAQTAFRALLTPEQAAKLDALKSQPGPGPFGRCGELQLTDEQKAQAHEIFAQLRTDLQQMRADTHQQIRAQLTPEQQTEFDALRPAAGAAGRWGGKHGMRGGPGFREPGAMLDRLSSALSLTDAQREDVKAIVDNLHTAIRARIEQARAAAGAPANP